MKRSIVKFWNVVKNFRIIVRKVKNKMYAGIGINIKF